MARRYDYVPPENVYGSSEDYSDGFQITGGDDSLDFGDDAASQWLRETEGLDVTGERQAKKALDLSAGQDFALGGATAADFQLERINKMGYNVIAGIQAALEGNLDASSVGLNTIDVDVAVEDFKKLTGVSPKDFAKRLKVPEGVMPSRHPQDVRTMISMLGTTAETKMQAGPGSSLPGNFLDVEGQNRSDQQLEQALAGISSVAEYYMSDVTKGSSVYGNRKRMIEEQLTKRVMEMPFHSESRTIVPVPNELNVLGVVPTQGNWGGYTDERGRYQGGGTPYTRIGFANIEGELTEGSPEWNALNPNAKRSLLPLKGIPKKGSMSDEARQAIISDMKAKQSETYEKEIYGKLQFARKVLQEQFPTMSDESQGQGRMSAWQQNREDWDKRSDLMNEAAILDLDMNQPEFDGNPYMPIKSGMKIKPGMTAKGSGRGGMYGDRGLSEQDIYVQEGVLPDELVEAAEEAVIDTSTDIGRYRARMKGPAQGSAEWLKQRKGNITASIAEEFGYGMGVEQVAANLAAERLGYGSKWRGNAYTARGTKFEKSALSSFLSTEGKGLAYEEAFFETNEDMPGFGVSPDGRLFNPDGTSAGLLELKVLSDSMMKGAVKKYTPQMQMQMAVTGESSTNFYALNADTGEYEHDIVYADPDMQKGLIESGKAALDMAAGLDLRGVRDLDKKIKQAGRKKMQHDAGKPAGQEAKFSPDVSASTAMVPFNSDVQLPDRTGNKLVVSVPEIEGLTDFMEGFGGGGDDDGDDTARAELREFAAALKEAIKGVQSFGKELMAGTESVLSEERIAAQSGMATGEVRGMRMMLENVMTPAGISNTMSSAGDLVRDMNNKTKIAKTYGNIVTNIKASDLSGVQGVVAPSVEQARDMGGQEWIAWAVQQGQGMTREERSYFFSEVMNMPELAVNRADGEKILGAYSAMDVEGAVEQKGGGLEVTQRLRKYDEATGTVGRKTGITAEAAIATDRIDSGVGLVSNFAKASLISENEFLEGLERLKGKGPKTSEITGWSPGDPRPNLFDPTSWGHKDIKQPAAYGVSPDSSIDGFEELDYAVPETNIGPMSDQSRTSINNKVINKVDVKVDIAADRSYEVKANANGDEAIDVGTGLGTGD